MRGRILQRTRRGGALLLTLAFVVLVTVAILAFVAHTQSALLTARTTVSRLESDNLVTSAVEATLSDLRMEMLAGASNVVRTNFGSLDPMIVRRRWAMVPSRSVSSSLPATGFENLVKQSLSGKGFYPGSTAASNFTSNGPALNTGNQRAVAVNTTTPSPDGRTLSAYRWDQVALASLSFSNKPLPDWIYVTRRGVPLSGSSLVEAEAGKTAPANTNYVVGRYAYQIYDVGGLLDINTAGLPSKFATNAAAKGGVQWADLTALGLSQSQVDELMEARFSATRSYSDLPERIRYEAERDGFLSPLAAGGSSDTFFYSRQDLIRYFLKLLGVSKVNSLTDPQRAILASLTQDSRFLTSPSWNPAPLGSTERPAIKQETAGGNNSYGKDDLFNPVIVTNTVAASKTFTRPRASDPRTMSGVQEVQAKAGEPYVLSRFPLDRLRLITRDATADKNSLIYRYFGLTRSSADDPWVYDHGTSETSGNSERILYLDEVRNGDFTDDGKPRELDFVEMLKVAISSGSLGKSAGTRNGGASEGNQRDQRVNYQLMQIFANIIDQYDEDGYPTHIQFDGQEFYGVENLPYLQRVKLFMARLLEDSYTALDSKGKPLRNQPYSIVWLPEVWNPHDKNQALPSDRPTNFRVVADTMGVAFPMKYRDSANNTDTYYQSGLAEFDPEKNYIELTPEAVSRFYEPTMINRTSLGTPSVPLASIDRKPPPPDPATAEYVDWSLLPPVDSDLAGIASPAIFVNLDVAKIGLMYYTNNSKPGLTFAMEYQDPKTKTWHRYMERLLMRAGVDGGTDAPRGRSKNQADYDVQNNGRVLGFDPRTDRFSTYRLQERDSVSEAYVDNASLRPDSGNGYGLGYNSTDGERQSPAADSNGNYGWTMGYASISTKAKSGTSGTVGYAMGTILQNTTTGTRYTDPDGVLRSGDGILASGTDAEGQMYWPQNYASRPIILNRPFRSVAELGYVFRDTPCRSLDLFTENSGDSNLLDFFCIDETPDDAITSARVSANTRNVKVLESLLKGALRDPVTGGTLSDTRAGEAAKALVDLTTNTAKGPLLNRSELATKFLSSLPLPSGDKLERIKRQREVFVRALADSLETRTWNLLIDLFAQTGRVPNGKKTFADFRVESERHVWVHLAIDRVTGKVINLNVESVHD